MERSNDDWVGALSMPGEHQTQALSDLAGVIRRGLSFALSKYLSPNDPNFESLTEEVVQDTLLRVLDNLASFEGRSKFTTWVHKIAVRIALTELRRKRWLDVSLDEMTASAETTAQRGLLADDGHSPEQAAERTDVIENIERIISEELTDKQRTALLAIGVQGMPMPIVADRLGMKRNALYKLLHDARVKLKKRLQAEGLAPDEIMALFERR